jgi:hypothetical protein
MRDVLRRLVASRANLGLALGIAAAYLALFLVAVADLTIDGAARSASLFLVAGWENLVFRQQAPFQFEAAGSACCVPILFLLLGVQVTASLIALMGLLIPAAFVFLLAGVVLTLRAAARSCAEAAA